MKKLYLIFCFFIILYAKEDLLKTLNEVNEIAFQSKLTIEKTPSNVTVLKRDFIQKTGAKTLFELLKFVPGIQTSISSTGRRMLIIRGNREGFRDKIKFLINGESITNNLFNNQYYYYNFPTSLIKRVEITLTPDAVTYGDNAYLGVINVITLDELNDNQISLYKSNKNETIFSLFQKLNNLSIDAYYLYSNPFYKSTTTYLIDLYNLHIRPYRNISPKFLEKNLGFGIKYKKENSTIKYRINTYKESNFFGALNLPPVKDDKYITIIQQFLNYNYSNFLNDNWKNSFNTGIKLYKLYGAYRLFPYDFNETIDNNPDNDIIYGARINEYEMYLNNILTFINNKHFTNFIFDIKYAKPYNYSMYLNNTPKDNFALKSKINRKIFEFAIEDLYYLTEKFSIIYGGRYSHYNDFGSNFSYKLGSVYNLNDLTTFKLLFNTAFRAPSWYELYSKNIFTFSGNIGLKAEKIKMGEFIYNQKINTTNSFKFSFYLGKEYNYINRAYSKSTGSEIYKNLGDFLIRGYEVSYKKILKKGTFGISYSYNNNKPLFKNIVLNNFNEYQYLGIRKHIANSYFSYEIFPDINFFISSFYGSKIKTFEPYTVKRYFSLNSNILYNKNDLTLKIGIDNITNHKNYDYSLPSDAIYARYAFFQKDFSIPEIGRRIYFNIIKKW